MNALCANLISQDVIYMYSLALSGSLTSIPSPILLEKSVWPFDLHKQKLSEEENTTQLTYQTRSPRLLQTPEENVLCGILQQKLQDVKTPLNEPIVTDDYGICRATTENCDA